MRKALIIKELREAIAPVGAAIVVYLWLVLSYTGIPILPLFSSSQVEIPFINSSFILLFGTISFFFAAVLGLKQSVWESMQGTTLFLLHRPMDRRAIYGIKILVGLSLYLVCSAVPILLFGAWAATPGTHASPFQWSMTEGCWAIWLSMSLVYLGSFLSGIRPSHWLGSRLYPLAAAGVLAIFVNFIPFWWILGVFVLLLVAGLFWSCVLLATTTRDYP